MEAEISNNRLQILNKIDEFERKGLFSKDVEDDPPTIPLEANKVDYLNKKLSHKILSEFVNFYAKHFIYSLVKKQQLILKETIGIENYIKIKNSGAILTCNHFNAFDNFAVYLAIEKELGRKRLYKVIREGNYTSFPGIYGLFFRHCNTLPLSRRFSTMQLFMSSIKTLLARGEKILVYAEQGMWWNYKKPRPLTNGAFKFAVQNKVPVLPLFITMEDSDKLDQDGYPIQIYTVHILEPIYQKPEYSEKQNVEYLKNLNYTMCKEVYEKTYGIKLEYLK